MIEKLRDLDWWAQEHILKYKVPTPRLFWLAIFIGELLSLPFTDPSKGLLSWYALAVYSLQLIFWFITLFFLTLTWGKVVLDRDVYRKITWKHYTGISKMDF